MTFNETYCKILLELSSNKNVVHRFVQKFYREPADAGEAASMQDSAKDIIDSFIPLMRQNKTKHRDIFQYTSESDILQDINAALAKSSKREMRRADKTGAKKVFENELVVVRRITTYEAAVIYGKGTKWCVSSTETKKGSPMPIGRMYFNHYTADGNLYYLLCKPGAEKIDVALRSLFNKLYAMKPNDKFAAVLTPDAIEAYFADNDNISTKSFMELIDALQVPFNVFKRQPASS
jgi:hypothetical protein